ncbi:ISL3 family transposase [Sinorhizobium meliloti]|uniref:ISL3 family transposase n=5 Tax=Rhizobium meliloti TaxID=382 RepID=UPI00142E0733|nr:ISL3 family transposase [Sinorhizobium meliloti]MDE3768699.1 ISL3 family transposase [Sinorhizobium meliloti]MDE3777714.1 ISL3 family transposase [Sinorhizobium meliloti]MDE3787829.1 ISL3 family transposase [Sinorhizobium meliloti]MDE3795672.1 ISL3 family transposase [Sinorhizobium meliloti]MDE3804769.1 ISL3 family transposase [Sinorhizobium meliloti]
MVSAAGPAFGICPDCGLRTRNRHGWSNRSLQDLPVQGKTVTVKLRLSRWRCAHQKCERQTFTDRLPTIASPYARRTRRVSEIVGLLGHSAGGRPGERLMQRLGMPVSDDTILRQLKRDAARAHRDATIRVVGIDDWSWRRSWRYGTMIVDLERRSVVDILEDRSVASVARWLEQHPSVEIVSRDRCGLYAQAAREGAPQARQVADRFHLMQNLRVAIEEQMSLAGRATGRALLPDKSIGSAQIDLIQDDPHVDATHRRRVRHRQSRQAVFDTVHALNEEGLSYSEIARRTGYGRRSIAKWLTFETPPDRQKAALKPTSPLYFEAFLAACWKDGNRCGRHLFHDIKQRGYTGSFSNLERLLASWRRSERSVEGSASSAPIISHQRGRGVVPIRDPETGHVISPVVAAALCMKPRSMLTITQARKVDALKQGAPEFALMRSLGMRFRGIFRSRDPGKLDSWIDDAVKAGLVAVARFARVLHRDLDAVCNAIELPWSNGQAEGQINRLKTIKRAMYGRAGPELLRARMLPLEQNRHTK